MKLEYDRVNVLLGKVHGPKPSMYTSYQEANCPGYILAYLQPFTSLS